MDANEIKRLANGFVRDRQAGGYVWLPRSSSDAGGSGHSEAIIEPAYSGPNAGVSTVPRVYSRHADGNGALALDRKGRLMASPPRADGVRRDIGMVQPNVAVDTDAGRKRPVKKCTGCPFNKGCTIKTRHPFLQRWCRLEWQNGPWVSWKIAAVWVVAIAVAAPVFMGWVR